MNEGKYIKQDIINIYAKSQNINLHQSSNVKCEECRKKRN